MLPLSFNREKNHSLKHIKYQPKKQLSDLVSGKKPRMYYF